MRKSFSSYNVTTSHSRASSVSAHSDSPVTVSSKLFDIASNASTSEAIPIAGAAVFPLQTLLHQTYILRTLLNGTRLFLVMVSDASSSARLGRLWTNLSAFPSITDLRAALTGFVTPLNPDR
ncbi:BZ3500_MvSof-1268-A1-R1_Chr6-3g08985 [Microbotryum saponariae]|uniref:BZ3500_MvSof-1268-A1-R1_Chr6-3g08985 protein n=1 Tax=Microbotryum saponariae TaxID=289078 RepID=A0A2X0NP78_9BASI|nr:BZ3500_MvSof-1268-A1-R1_Chr6-3g08985 [Microbotryum saponariae]SDA07587.1 BZ3501_MvSof-1269-A2-R1_Chr6-2g08689 [Microbotryum saponariae]